MDGTKSPESFPGDFFSQVEEAREAVKLFVERKINYLQNQMPAGYSIELQVKISTDPERRDDNATYMRIGVPRQRYSGIKLAPQEKKSLGVILSRRFSSFRLMDVWRKSRG